MGRELVLLDETDSTNSYASRLFESGDLRNGMAIIADRQSAGRGRMQREWHSKGCLCMTVAVEVKTSPDGVGPITLTAGVAAALGITALTDYSAMIKYPNDIMADSRKLGGVLSEFKNGDKRFVLLGFGINVEQEVFRDEIKDIAVSLRQLGIGTERESVAAALLNELEPMVDLFFKKGFTAVRPYWLELNCTIGNDIVVKRPSGRIEGKAINLDDEGALVVETAEGTERIDTGDFLQGR